MAWEASHKEEEDVQDVESFNSLNSESVGTANIAFESKKRCLIGSPRYCGNVFGQEEPLCDIPEPP